MKQQLIKWVGGFVIASCLVMQAAAEKITLFAAASLTNALQDIASQYQKRQRCAGDVFLCCVVNLGASDCTRGTGRSVYLRRSAMDGLCD